MVLSRAVTFNLYYGSTVSQPGLVKQRQALPAHPPLALVPLGRAKVLRRRGAAAAQVTQGVAASRCRGETLLGAQHLSDARAEHLARAEARAARHGFERRLVLRTGAQVRLAATTHARLGRREVRAPAEMQGRCGGDEGEVQGRCRCDSLGAAEQHDLMTGLAREVLLVVEDLDRVEREVEASHHVSSTLVAPVPQPPRRSRAPQPAALGLATRFARELACGDVVTNVVTDAVTDAI